MALPIVEVGFSLLASVAYLWSGRLLVPIGMHALVNGAALVKEAPAALPGGLARAVAAL